MENPLSLDEELMEEKKVGNLTGFFYQSAS